jgi:hypothetical protein
MSKLFKLTSLALFWAGACLGAEEDGIARRYFSALWLKQSMIASLLVSGGQEHTKDQDNDSLSFVMYFGGFMHGIHMSTMLTEKNQPLQFPTPQFQKVGDSVLSIMGFMKEQERFIQDDTEARDILTAWYLATHPESTESQKSRGQMYLKVIQSLRDKKGKSPDLPLPKE